MQAPVEIEREGEGEWKRERSEHLLLKKKKKKFLFQSHVSPCVKAFVSREGQKCLESIINSIPIDL